MVSALRPKEDITPDQIPENNRSLENDAASTEAAPPREIPSTSERFETESSPAVEIQDHSTDSAIDMLRSKLRKTRRPAQIPQVRDALTRQVEEVLSEGLEDVFQELTPVQQQEFKIKGEEAAFTIRQILSHTKVKIREIFKLIFEWLQMLPGINRFFLEQEAKIKAEKIMALKHFDDGKKK